MCDSWVFEGFPNDAERRRRFRYSKGVELTREQLEAAIDAAPDDASRYAVLGDFLSAQGDPRGELIALELDASKPTRARRERETALQWLKGIRVNAPHRAQWRWGFVHTLAFELARQDGWEEHRGDWPETLLARDLKHPSCRFLRELILEADPVEDGLRWLAGHAPVTLRSLHLVANELDLAAVPAFARLERLIIACQLLLPAKLELPALTELTLPVDALSSRALELVLSGVAPRLARLTLGSLEPLEPSHLGPVFTLPSLEHLVLRADGMTRPAVEALVDSPLAERLITLDVSRSGLDADAAKRLLKLAPRFRRLSSLVLGEGVEA